jgi:hypothetical protein
VRRREQTRAVLTAVRREEQSAGLAESPVVAAQWNGTDKDRLSLVFPSDQPTHVTRGQIISILVAQRMNP